MCKLLTRPFAALVLGMLIGAAAAPAQAQTRADVVKCNQPATAVEACSRLMRLPNISASDRSLLHNNRGIGYQARGDHDRAIRDFGESIRFNPKYVLAYINRAISYNTKGEVDLAIRDTDAAIRISPKTAAAYVVRSVSYNRKGEFDTAIRDANAAIRIDPKLADSYGARGYAYGKLGDIARARADFVHALKLNPNLAEVKTALADLDASVPAASARSDSAPPDADRPQEVAASEPATVDADEKAATGAAPAGRRVALVIGNSDYQFASRLKNPHNDAGDLSKLLQRLGFDVVEGRDLDRRGMEDKLREFGRKLDRADLALFFYAGHGIQVGGKNYLIPIDARLERAGDLRLDTVEIGDVLAQMEAQKRVNLVFLDACRDNPLARSFARSLGTRSTAVGRGLAAIQSAIGTMIAYATQPENAALDGDGRNSPFTTALLKHLGTPGLDVSLVMKRVRADVIAATREQQVPWDHSSLTGEVVLAR